MPAGDQAKIPAHHAPFSTNGHHSPAASNGAAPKPGPRVLATRSSFYRDTQYVMGWDIGDMARSVTIHAFVRAPFDSYVHDESRFWNASGLSVKLGAEGVRIQVQSIDALLLGGIAFDTPSTADDAPPSPDLRSFPLYQDEDAADQAAFEAIDRDPAHLLMVAQSGPDIVATMQLSFLPGLARRGALRAQIEAVRIDQAYRGHGLGSAIISWAISEARRRDCALVQLTSDKSRIPAHRFYERLGFVATHEGMKLTL